MASKKSRKYTPEQRARHDVRMNLKKNRNVRKQNLPMFFKTAGGKLDRDRPITYSEAECTKWRKDKAEINSKMGKFANQPKKTPKKVAQKEAA